MLEALLYFLTSAGAVAVSGVAAVMILLLGLARQEVARRAVNRYHAYGIVAALVFVLLVTLRFLTNV